MAPVTQLVSTGAIGVKYAQQLPLCMMLQTMAFVAFNKVNLYGNMHMLNDFPSTCSPYT